MSQQTTQPTQAPAAAQPALIKMSAQEAQAFLIHNIYEPVFFEKLSAHGIRPSTPDEATAYLEMGAKLFNASLLENTKTSNSRLDFLKQANARLDDALAKRYGGAAPQVQSQKTANDQRIRQDAVSLAQHPQVREAFLAFQGQAAA